MGFIEQGGPYLVLCLLHVLLVLPASKVASKIVLALALVTTDVALEWVLVAVAAHVDGVEDVVREVDVTVLAVMQHVGVLQRGREAWGWCTRLAVGDARSAGAPAVLTALTPTSRATVTMWRSSGLRGDWGGGGGMCHASSDCHRSRGGVGLLDEKGFFFNNRLSTWRHGRLIWGPGL